MNDIERGLRVVVKDRSLVKQGVSGTAEEIFQGLFRRSGSIRSVIMTISLIRPKASNLSVVPCRVAVPICRFEMIDE